MVGGQTDAAVLARRPVLTTALFCQSQLQTWLAKMWEVVPDWWYSAFVATDDVRTQKRDAMVRFMTAIIKAQRFMYTNPRRDQKKSPSTTPRRSPT